MDVAMWGRALAGIPRIDKPQWDDLDFLARWLIATRFTVAVMTFLSSAIAGLLAYRDGSFDWLTWTLVTVGLLFAHATNNLVNDMTDHARGVDKDNYFRTQYGPHPLEHGLMSRRQMLVYTVVTGAIALAAGGYLVATRGEATLTLLGIGCFFVLFYTWPLKGLGLGELAVLVVWGPLMVGGGYYVITGALHGNVIVASLPFALAATTVLFGKHIDKFELDRDKGIRTLPVMMGQRAARHTTIGLLTLQYLVTAYLVAIGYLSPFMALTLLALPAWWLAVRMHLRPRPAARPSRYPEDVWPLWYSAAVFRHTRRFGLLFVAGLLLENMV